MAALAAAGEAVVVAGAVVASVQARQPAQELGQGQAGQPAGMVQVVESTQA